ncbi:RDD family protein [Pseudovibrio sp. W64]|uniref:RDD family protein n=1 Tax=unclassified Pseudovibrio TaxID=2627060 RepID=UPI0007AE96C1|nr:MULTISPECIES: RDD family protein [unclassified Pseudovibrio]KZK84377.1 RDD family protein [Pseudovibrio sp. W64]KZK89190.1 RDD family protein [Pseudovibrio sp. Ad5]KZK95390.1 RDD family protein [Pseudovibrio sp. Ad46]
MYYYHDGKHEVGPFDVRNLRILRQNGLITESTLVRSTNGDDWTSAGQILDNEGTSATIEQNLSLDDTEVNTDQILKLRPASENLFPTLHAPLHEESSQSEVGTAPKGWLANPPTPWRRYAARLFDTTFNGVVLVMLLAFVFYAIAPAAADEFFSLFDGPGGRLIDLMFTASAASVLGGSLIGVSGTTLGKFIFGIKITRTDGQLLGFWDGLKRDFNVLLRGLGLGIPIVALFTMWGSYQRLKSNKTTSWDTEKYTAWHRPSGIGQYILNVIGIGLFFLILTMVRAMEQL